MTKLKHRTFKSDLAVVKFVRKKLLKQNARSLESPNPYYAACTYRGVDGMRCAVGWLIPNSLYTKNLEGMALKEIWDKIKCIFPKATPATKEMLHSLQRIHDTVAPSRWKASFDRLEDSL